MSVINVKNQFVSFDDDNEDVNEEAAANEAVVGSGGGGWPFLNREFEVCMSMCVW